MEALRTGWFAAPDTAVERTVAGRMEQEAFDQVPFVPATAPLFWNRRKA